MLKDEEPNRNQELLSIKELSLSFMMLRQLVELSTQQHREYDLKILKRENGSCSVQATPQYEFSTSAFATFYNSAKDNETCLSSHTHYKLQNPLHDPKLGIFLSDPDLDGIYHVDSLGESVVHVGSFFVANPFGVTFLLETARFNKGDTRGDSAFWVNAETQQHLGWIQKISTDAVDIDKRHFFSAYYFTLGLVSDFVFLPNALLEQLEMDNPQILFEVLFENGLIALIQDSIFADRLKEKGITSTLAVARHTKNVAAQLYENM